MSTAWGWDRPSAAQDQELLEIALQLREIHPAQETGEDRNGGEGVEGGLWYDGSCGGGTPAFRISVEATIVASDPEWTATNSACTQIGRLKIKFTNPPEKREVQYPFK